MEMYRFDAEVGRAMDRFESSGFVISGVLHLSREAIVNCAFLAPGGLIGYHQAAVPQLLMVVQGAGWVRSDSAERIPIHAGQAAFWKQGEWHESGTDNGMSAVIIESSRLEPSEFMPAL